MAKARHKYRDGKSDPRTVSEEKDADHRFDPADLIYDDEVLSVFQVLFEDVVCNTQAAHQDLAARLALVESVQNLRDYIIGFNENGDEIDTDLVYQMAARSGVNISAIVGGPGEALVEVFREVAEAAKLNVADEAPVVPELVDTRRKLHKIVPGYYIGSLTYEMIIESAWAEYRATGRRPASNDGFIMYGPLFGTGLTWEAVDKALQKGSHGLPGGETVPRILDEVGIPSRKNKLTLMPLDMIWSVWAYYVDKKRRPNPKDITPIVHGSLDGSNLSWKVVDLYLQAQGSNLVDFMDQALVPPTFFKGTLTHLDIILSAWAEYDVTGRRPTNDDTHLIIYGPLAWTGLTWNAVHHALQNGIHELPGEEQLATILNAANIPPNKKIFKGTLTHLDIIWSAWLEYLDTGRRPSLNDTDSVIMYGSLKGTGLTWGAVDQALQNGHHDLPSDETLAVILNAAGIPENQKTFKGTLTHKAIIDSAWAEYHATGRRPTRADNQPILYGPLAGTGLNWNTIHQALEDGRHGLPGEETLSELLTAAGVPKTKAQREACPPNNLPKEEPQQDMLDAPELSLTT